MKNPNPIRLITFGIWAVRRLCTYPMGEEMKTSIRVVSKTLYSRLSYLHATGRSVEETVNQYVSEGKKVSKDELVRCVEELRRYHHHRTAFELMDWVKKKSNIFVYRDHAIFMDLLSRVKGIDSAEMYFQDLPPDAKREQTYGALLNCYCKHKMVDKALTLFAEMNEREIASAALNYNNMMSLYMRVGQPEKVPPLFLEMKVKNVTPDTFTYKILVTCYSSLKDTAGVERVMKEMETEGSDRHDWTTYSNLAASYVKVGLFDKAELALKELERIMKPSDREAYHFLITLHAGISNLSEIYRVWRSLKSAFPITINSSYLVMLHALVKLDDYDGLEKCFREWESGCSSYDMRLTNVLLRAYVRQGMIGDARLLCCDAINRSSRLKYTTYEIFMDFFLRNRQPSVALRCLEVGLSHLKGTSWKPGQERVSAFLKLFEEEKDTAGAEKFCNMLKRASDFDIEGYRLLLSNHIDGKEENQQMMKLESDKIEIDSEIEELLELICPEKVFI